MTNETQAAKTVADIQGRSVFATIDSALEYIGKISAYEGFDDLKQAIVGAVADEAGNITLDPTIYNSEMAVTVAVMNEKIKGGNLKPVGIAVYPTPVLDAVLQSDEGKKWLAKLVEKESNLVALRPLRKEGATYEEAAAAMPTTLASFIAPTREGASGVMAAFEAVWRDVKKLVGAKNRSWAIANFSKKELRRAFESASYAAGTYPKVERQGGESSLFVFALNVAKVLASRLEEPLSVEYFDRCLETRDAHQINIEEDDDDAMLDLESILAEADAAEAADAE